MIRVSSRRREYRIVIPGQAVSFRSPHAAKYKRLVRQRGRAVIRRPAESERVDILIDYFHSGKRRMDMDNIAKCIIDALNGMAYHDDRQVHVQSAKAHCLDRTTYIYGGPVDLVKPLRRYAQYVFVRLGWEKD